MTEENAPVKLEESHFTEILIAVFVIVLTLVLVALYKRRKNARRGILITGLCESGKTVIFTQLLHKAFFPTFTSMKENIGDYLVKGTSLRIIDIPGHERLREKFLDRYKNIGRGIVFIVDSSNIQKDVRNVAEFLYNILSDTVLQGTSYLILCNKQDVPLAKTKNVVRTVLEKELSTLCVTKSRQLDSVDPNAKKTVVLGNNGKFEFSSFKVEFAECYASDKDNKASLGELEKWLEKIA